LFTPLKQQPLINEHCSGQTTIYLFRRPRQKDYLSLGIQGQLGKNCKNLFKGKKKAGDEDVAQALGSIPSIAKCLFFSVLKKEVCTSIPCRWMEVGC
jgi:hypothetical protein